MELIWKENKIFSIGFLLFILIGGVSLLLIEKGDAILFFSAHRTPFLDVFFTYTTQIVEEFGYLFIILCLVFYKFRYAILSLMTGLIVAIISGSAKWFFAHVRPSDFFKDNNIIDKLTYVEDIRLNVGTTSFPSGHTMSAFALFALLSLLFSSNKWFQLFCFACAISVALSRVYLVQHFLEDIYVGGIIGVFIACILFLYQKKYIIKPNTWINKNVFDLCKGKDNAIK